MKNHTPLLRKDHKVHANLIAKRKKVKDSVVNVVQM